MDTRPRITGADLGGLQTALEHGVYLLGAHFRELPAKNLNDALIVLSTQRDEFIQSGQTLYGLMFQAFIAGMIGEKQAIHDEPHNTSP